MNRGAFLNLLFLLIYKHRAKHGAIFLISFILVSLLSSVLFITSSIKHEVLSTLDAQPDFIVQKVRGGRSVDIDSDIVEEFSKIRGVSDVGARVYGRYFVIDQMEYFTVVGVDFFDKAIDKKLEKVFKDLDVKEFLKKDNMIVGEGVKKFLAKKHYKKYLHFKTPNADVKKVYIYDTFPKETNLISNDLIILDINLAREILGIDKNKATDIILNVPNDAERDNVKLKLLSKHYDSRVISKEDIENSYEYLFNYKGGVFLLLFIITLLTFMMILYQRYSMINSTDKKEIGILRAIGWSIKDILKLKVLETLFIGLWAFVLGVVFAYFYVYMFDAPFLKDMFIGFNNLENSVSFVPVVDFGLLFSLFLFFMVPFAASVLIPVWKIAVIDPVEAMK